MTIENDNAINDINKWAREKGFNRDDVDKSDMPEPSGLTLFSALSIRGLWKQEFSEVVDSNFFYNKFNEDKTVKNLTVLKSKRHRVKYVIFKKDVEITGKNSYIDSYRHPSKWA